jgi:two-component system C4-dicarboxylate transport sensor histidine kinase DctB
MPVQRFSLRFIPAVLFVLVIFVCTLWFVGRVVSRQSMEDLADEGTYRVELYVAYLQGVLEKYEGLPELLATNKRLVNFLLNPGSRERVQALNQYLETINNISDAADTYLMDREGLTIAASNWQAEHPFVGRNFSYRPYFKQAMQGHLGRFFALGSTSSRRGYYFAYPVRHKKEILGAVVIKINIDSVEHNWGHINDNFLVTDPDGVIFITTDPKWRYHVLFPLDPEVRQRIIDSRRYPDASLQPLNIIRTPAAEKGFIVSFTGDGQSSGKKYLQQTIAMPDAGWQVHLLSDISGVKRQVLRTRIAVGAVFLLAAMMLLLFVQRRQQLRDRHRFEQENRLMLEQANQKLESRVRERTGMLSQSNVRLLLEVDERRRAEEALRRTRNELVHAAKLATLGQMSAGINHELNQPLAAIRAYTENGRKLLEKERYSDVLWNLEQIAELIERMSHIGEQFKVFARRTDGKLHSIALHGVIDGALEILRPALKKSTARIRVTITPEELEVLGNSVRLQQVLVNLIGNGIHALANVEEGIIQVKAWYRNNEVWITVEDNGPGISRDLQEQIFEPFFTTRESGLGLGLTITQRIVQEMGGTINYVRVNRGACFEIRLQQQG